MYLTSVDDIYRIVSTFDRETVNPMNELGDCLYTSYEDSSKHCIAGQILVEIGFESLDPDMVEMDFVTLLEEYPEYNVFTEDAVTTIQSLQNITDKLTIQNISNAWGQAIDEVFENYGK